MPNRGRKSSLPTKQHRPRKALQPKTAANLISDVRHLIEETRSKTAAAVNAGLTFLYWRIGKRIREEVLQGERAGYGHQILSTLSRELAAEYGSSFAKENLWRMMQFAAAFPDEQIVVSLIRQLSWTHFIALIPLKSGSSEFAVLYQSFTLSESCRLKSIFPEGKNMNSRGWQPHRR